MAENEEKPIENEGTPPETPAPLAAPPAVEEPVAAPAIVPPEPASSPPPPEKVASEVALPPLPGIGGQPASNEVIVTGHRRFGPDLPTQDELDMQDRLVAHDMMQGHIKPETYSSLFAKQDTLGKIGTLFGLLISGAGSGLAKQPNLVMEMMNKEIQNDLAAQQHSAENKQNFLRISESLGQAPALRAKNKSDAKYLDSQTAKNMMTTAAGHALMGTYDAMAPGETKDLTGAMLKNTVLPAIQQENAMNNKNTIAVLNARSALRGDVDPVANAIKTAVDDKRMRQLANLTSISGIQGYNPARADEEAGRVKANRAMGQIYVDAFNKLRNEHFAGWLKPGQRESDIATIAGLMAKAGGAMSTEMVKELSNAYFPQAGDLDSTTEAKFKNGLNHLQQLEANTPMLDQYPGLKSPFPWAGAGARGERSKEETLKSDKPKSDKPKEAEAKKGPKEGDMKDGYKFTNGKWIFQGKKK